MWLAVLLRRFLFRGCFLVGRATAPDFDAGLFDGLGEGGEAPAGDLIALTTTQLGEGLDGLQGETFLVLLDHECLLLVGETGATFAAHFHVFVLAQVVVEGGFLDVGPGVGRLLCTLLASQDLLDRETFHVEDRGLVDLLLGDDAQRATHGLGSNFDFGVFGGVFHFVFPSLLCVSVFVCCFVCRVIRRHSQHSPSQGIRNPLRSFFSNFLAKYCPCSFYFYYPGVGMPFATRTCARAHYYGARLSLRPRLMHLPCQTMIKNITERACNIICKRYLVPMAHSSAPNRRKHCLYVSNDS